MQLLDSGFLFALIDRNEQRHQDVLRASSHIAGPVLLPSVVITEVAYLVQRAQGAAAVATFLDLIASGQFQLLEPTLEDYIRAAEVIRQYADSKIDLVDAILVAVAERLEIERILTIDARHFRMFRPKHTPAFTILP